MFASLCLLLGALAQGSGPPLMVSAAVSLSEALQEIAGVYRAAGGGPVSFNLAGSNVLARQIVNGAPVDVFISADEAQMEVVARAGLIADGSRMAVTANTLVLVVDPRISINGAADLAKPEIRRIAIGDPAAVPAGVYARSYLEKIGLWTALEPKVVPTTNVRAALAAVENGSATAALVYGTDARLAPRLRVAAVIGGAAAPQIIYPAAVVKTSRQSAAAGHFLQFLRSAVASAIFERHGFAAPPARR